MSKPLRKPYFKNVDKDNEVFEQQFIILTLKNGIKLVISSDTFNGIIMSGDVYNCVFCNVQIETKALKERHKTSVDHKKFLSTLPYIDELSENLVRQIDKNVCYCTICNVTTSTIFLMRHVKTDEHVDELNRAILRGTTYKPMDENNNQ